tara:strand:- start:5027 stop:6460 length:1434 start_codon:yes stop_codon:yes gene_type:complete
MRAIGNTPVDGEVRAVASGALANGDAVIVNANGTVSVVAGTSITEATGTPVQFLPSARARVGGGAYDSNSNKVLFVYADYGNSYVLTGVVGTVSGTAISFGTPVVIYSGFNFGGPFPVTFDPVANKFVVIFTGTNSYASSKVVTISGTSLSVGSEVIVDNTVSGHDAASMCYDSGNGKHVVITNGYRTRVGTVSGTSISWGSRADFETNASTTPSITFDPVAEKVLIVWFNGDGSPSLKGEAVLGTVSGTSISFGSTTVWESAGGIGNLVSVYHAGSQQHLAVYNDNGTSGRVVALTVSGASITFGSPSQFVGVSASDIAPAVHLASEKLVIAYSNSSITYVTSGTVSGSSLSFTAPVNVGAALVGAMSVYDEDQETVAIAHNGPASTYAGTSVVYRPAYATTNLTSENFVGFANSGYASGQSSVINSACSVDKNQSGLTAGQDYFVQLDGTLGETAADPSVLAGTAVSATEIIVKG